MKGLDSGARIPAAAAHAAGYSVLFRYLYNLTSGEVQDVRASGCSLSLIAEFDGQNWHPVAQAPQYGRGHGITAANQARALGAPAGTIIWATADTFVGQNAYGNVATYLDGFRQGLGEYRPGLYGGARLVRTMLDQGHCDAGWLTGAYSWDDGYPRAKAGACAAQLPDQVKVGGVTCDVNDIYMPLNGFWFPTVNGPAPATQAAADVAPIPQQETHRMETVKFPDKDTLWLHGYDRDGEFFHDLTADNDPVLTGSLPQRLLASGNDKLDAAFHRCTGL